MSKSVAKEQESPAPLPQDFLLRPAVKGLITSTDGVLLQKERHTTERCSGNSSVVELQARKQPRELSPANW